MGKNPTHPRLIADINNLKKEGVSFINPPRNKTKRLYKEAYPADRQQLLIKPINMHNFRFQIPKGIFDNYFEGNRDIVVLSEKTGLPCSKNFPVNKTDKHPRTQLGASEVFTMELPIVLMTKMSKDLIFYTYFDGMSDDEEERKYYDLIVQGFRTGKTYVTYKTDAHAATWWQWMDVKIDLPQIALPKLSNDYVISPEDTRKFRQALQPIRNRSFRGEQLRVFGSKCIFTGCTYEPLLEVAHGYHFRGAKDDHITNGWPARGDWHTLYDRYDVGINPITLTIEVKEPFRSNHPEYGMRHGQKVIISEGVELNADALRWRYDRFLMPNAEREKLEKEERKIAREARKAEKAKHLFVPYQE